eukprot:scaffold8200_cov277-Pinguiococcus_pyrenoidosus.AAC.6
MRVRQEGVAYPMIFSIFKQLRPSSQSRGRARALYNPPSTEETHFDSPSASVSGQSDARVVRASTHLQEAVHGARPSASTGARSPTSHWRASSAANEAPPREAWSRAIGPDPPRLKAPEQASVPAEADQESARGFGCARNSLAPQPPPPRTIRVDLPPPRAGRERRQCCRHEALTR